MNGIEWFRYPNGDIELVTNKGVFLCVTKRLGLARFRVWYSFPDGVPQTPEVAKRLESELKILYAQDEQNWAPRGDVVEAVDG